MTDEIWFTLRLNKAKSLGAKRVTSWGSFIGTKPTYLVFIRFCEKPKIHEPYYSLTFSDRYALISYRT